MKHDVVVIGSGIGGYPAACYLADRGLSVAVVEEHLVGGECTNYGCVPSKALYHFAESLKSLEKVRGPVPYDWQDLANWVREVVREVREGLENLLEAKGVAVYRGRGRVLSARKVAVEARGEAAELEASNIVLAMGTDPSDIPVAKFDGRNVISNREALFLEERPSSVLIVGGGVVGVELANMFSSLGVEVTLVELLEHILPFTDRDIAAALKSHLLQRGVRVLERTTVARVEVVGNKCLAELSSGDRLEVDKVVVGVGRKPKTRGVGLENIAVDLDEKGFIRVGERLETRTPGVYASGDVVGGPLLAHKALLESIAVAKRIAGEESFTIDYKLVPITIFTGLEVASMGYTEKELLANSVKYVKYRVPMHYLSSIRVKGYRSSFAKILLDERGEKVLGVHIVAPSASEVISSYLPLYAGKLKLKEVAKTPYPHLTVSESLREAAEYILGEPVHAILKK